MTQKNILLYILLLIINIHSEAKTIEKNDIILSIPSLAKTPWEEQAGADARASIFKSTSHLKVYYNINKIQSVGFQAGGSILRLSNIKLKENFIN